MSYRLPLATTSGHGVVQVGSNLSSSPNLSMQLLAEPVLINPIRPAALGAHPTISQV